MKYIITGIESSGKSLILADKAIALLARNTRWHKKYGFKRILYSNLKFSEEIEKEFNGFIKYWKDLPDILGIEGADIIWDEISTYFSAEKRAPLSFEVNKWLRQGAKRGVSIYGSAQEFHDIHVQFRRRVFQCDHVSKVAGSRRAGLNFPPVKQIWGLCWTRNLKINPYNELIPEYSDNFGKPFLITKKRCSIFNTYAKIETDSKLAFEIK